MSLIRGLVSARTWLALVHHLVGLAVSLAATVTIVVTVAVGTALLPLAFVGVPVLGLAARFTDLYAAIDRARFGLLGVDIPRWPADPRRGYRWLLIPRRETLFGRVTRGRVLHALLRLPLAAVAVALSTVFWAAGVTGLAAPLYVGSLPGGGFSINAHVYPGRGPEFIAFGVGLVALLTAPLLTRGFANLDAAFTRLLIAPPRDAELEARVNELEFSRERVVDAAEAERKRIERDLHDGAQQRLVALAMELGRAKAKFADDVEGAAALIDQAHSEAKAALVELRDLVRGVHPPVLTDRGLDAAISGLVARCPIPVETQYDVPIRPRPAVEAVAYFTIAEALTNVAKHSRATHVRVVVEGAPGPAGTLNIVVSDDGIGGADADGAGLRGLADRLGGIDGALSVESPPGGPTIISAILPC
jgi:signal transduction histidine kinase